MTPFQQDSRLRKALKKSALALTVAGGLTMMGCGSNVEYVDEEVMTPTKGVITEVEEVQTNRFLISDETIVETKADSRIIAAYLDGTRDTFTLDEARLVAADSLSGNRRSSASRIVNYGLMGYLMGRSMSTPTTASAYKNSGVYNRVNGQAGATMRNTANRSVVRRPVTRKTGFGGGARSTRSFGG